MRGACLGSLSAPGGGRETYGAEAACLSQAGARSARPQLKPAELPGRAHLSSFAPQPTQMCETVMTGV